MPSPVVDRFWCLDVHVCHVGHVTFNEKPNSLTGDIGCRQSSSIDSSRVELGIQCIHVLSLNPLTLDATRHSKLRDRWGSQWSAEYGVHDEMVALWVDGKRNQGMRPMHRRPEIRSWGQWLLNDPVPGCGHLVKGVKVCLNSTSFKGRWQSPSSHTRSFMVAFTGKNLRIQSEGDSPWSSVHTR